MSCPSVTTSNVPLGLGYNSNGRPTTLAEIANVEVSSVTSSEVITNNISPETGNIVYINSQVSAVSYLGAGGGGVSNFVELGDVIPGLNLTTVPNEIISVNESSQLVPSSVSEIIAANNIATTTYVNNNFVLTSTNAVLSALVESINDDLTNHISDPTIHFTSSQLTNHFVLTATNAVLSALVESINDDLTNHVGDPTIHFTSSQLTNHFVLTSTNAVLSSTVSTHISDSTIHFTTGTLTSNFSVTSHNHALSGLTDTNISTGNITAGAFLAWSASVSRWAPSALDATLLSIATLNPGAGTMIYFTGTNLAATAALTAGGLAFARTASLGGNGSIYYSLDGEIERLSPATENAILYLNAEGLPSWTDGTTDEGAVLTIVGGVPAWVAP